MIPVSKKTRSITRVRFTQASFWRQEKCSGRSKIGRQQRRSHANALRTTVHSWWIEISELDAHASPQAQFPQRARRSRSTFNPLSTADAKSEVPAAALK